MSNQPITPALNINTRDAINVQDALTRQKIKAEEVCIKGVLREILKREPTIEDAKLCSQILSEPWDGTYRLFYNQKELGTVKYVDKENIFRVEFYPVKKVERRKKKMFALSNNKK